MYNLKNHRQGQLSKLQVISISTEKQVLEK